ncbi:MAG: cation transporter [Lachnospiraceae bacterium]|jgi:cation diffusion facilitator family transporter|nr:cation transporter [Lachnospiraceae bacterium]
MTDFLVKRLIPDYGHTENQTVRMRYGMLSGIVGIICNLILFISKLSVGMLINSISVMADAFNNLSDGASSLIGFVGMKMAGKPADENHPFGHGRIEYISAFVVAFIVIEVGFSLFKSSLGKIFHPEELNFNRVSVFILLMSVGIKLWMGIFNRKLGNRIHSSVMLAASADSMGDVAATAATLFSILVYRFAGKNIDGIVGLAVSAVVMIAGVNIARDTLKPLIGAPIDPKLYEEINNFVKSFDGIVGTHDLIIHNYGPSRSMASIHAEVPCDVDIRKSHEIIDRIEREAYQRFQMSLVIHMDPIETKNQQLLYYKEMLGNVLKEVDSRLAFHDLRMTEGSQQVNLIFDLVIPRDYQQNQYELVKAQVAKEIQNQDPKCCCVITMENSYCAEH